jgi:hypothetical protein
VVELVERGRPDWLESACRRGVVCDALVISGHFDNGTEFYTDSFVDREFLTLQEMQTASCSASCSGLFSQLKEVYLFGCNTLKSQPTQVPSAEIARSLVRSGQAPAEAARLAALLGERYGQSNRDRLRHVFKERAGAVRLFFAGAAGAFGRAAARALLPVRPGRRGRQRPPEPDPAGPVRAEFDGRGAGPDRCGSARRLPRRRVWPRGRESGAGAEDRLHAPGAAA